MKPLESLYQDALIALNNGRLLDAESLFKEFLKKEPNHVGALKRLSASRRREPFQGIPQKGT